MKYRFLNRAQNSKLIVFFNGWGCIKPAELDCEDFDVLLIEDYRSFEPIDADFSAYEKKYLAAWSFGVYTCSYYYETFKNFDGFTAVNGTLKPIDDNFGINTAAFNMTLNNFNELTLGKFMKKIGAPSIENRSIEDLKQELISVNSLKINQFLPFNKVFISNKDKIFTYKNSLNFWRQTNAEIIEADAPHYIFGIFKNWSSLI